ncbi:MAG TPA: helix-turn-helix domain-containing protein [Candidatus Dormibacteraeota bacterium]|nr:helix-turn-helix domain-containing protein [Candidatus Dormibacteraeota bacterium]
MPSENREKILQAAFAVLSRQGYENTSIKDIAEEAGVAQGLVHYYFKSKEQLVLAVLLAVCTKMELPGAEGAAGALAAFENLKDLLKNSKDTHALYLQLIAVGFHDKELGAGVLDFLRTDRGHVEQIARQVLAEREVDPAPARAIASVVWGAILGIMVQNIIDPDFNGDEAVDALAAMSLAAVYPQTQSA